MAKFFPSGHLVRHGKLSEKDSFLIIAAIAAMGALVFVAVHALDTFRDRNNLERELQASTERIQEQERSDATKKQREAEESLRLQLERSARAAGEVPGSHYFNP